MTSAVGHVVGVIEEVTCLGVMVTIDRRAAVHSYAIGSIPGVQGSHMARCGCYFIVFGASPESPVPNYLLLLAIYLEKVLTIFILIDIEKK